MDMFTISSFSCSLLKHTCPQNSWFPSLGTMAPIGLFGVRLTYHHPPTASCLIPLVVAALLTHFHSASILSALATICWEDPNLRQTQISLCVAVCELDRKSTRLNSSH